MSQMFICFVSLLIRIYFCASRSSSSPNIIYLLMDDLGFSDVGWTTLPLTNDDNNFSFKTPILDGLAMNGIRLNYHYSEPICSPSRSSFLSGKYSYKTGVGNVIQPNTNVHTSLSLKLIGQIFQENNYKTLFAGKYHIGYESLSQLPFNRGFDECLFFMFGTNYYSHKRCNPWKYYDSANVDILNPDVVEERNNLYGDDGLCGYDLFDESYNIIYDDTTYMERLYVDKIINFILENNCKKQQYFIYYAMKTPHSPYQQPPKYYNEECKHITDINRNILCQMMQYQDELIGEILQYIDDNTIIIFAGDNGADLSGQNAPLRGLKQSVFEGGIRSPSFISGPYITNNINNNNGFEYNKLAFIGDWYPTMIDMANLDIDINNDIDGINLWEDIVKQCLFRNKQKKKFRNKQKKKKNKEKTKSRDEIIRLGLCNNNNEIGEIDIYDSFFYATYIRKDQWKLIVNGSITRCSNADKNTDSLFSSYKNIFNNDFDEDINIKPNTEIYEKYMLSKNDYLYRSVLYDSLNEQQKNNINNFKYDEIMLFNIHDDPIESINLADEYSDVVTELFDKLNIERFNYQSRNRQPPLAISTLAQVDSYDCDLETNFVLSWADNPIYSNNSFNDWNNVWQNAINIKQICH